MRHDQDDAIQTRRVCESLRTLPVPEMPPLLSTRLRVVASRERARRLRRATWGQRLRSAGSALMLSFNNLMRPFAIPAAGGLASAMFLFLTLVPEAYPLRARAGRPDVPTPLSTEASFKMMGPIDITEEELVLDLTIDEQGRVLDYSLPGGQRPGKALRRSIENTVLFTEFIPATAFGQPVSGKLRISFHRRQINVKG
ncbi:MAG: DUF2309 domain-containing protein [Acidobacteria bacterium]|nr:DUF2309 domain-containing protein [Acidobacteriota bacterium]